MPYEDAAADRSHWTTLRAYFDEVSELSPEARESYLLRLEQADPPMAAMLKDLLHSSATDFLATPPWRSASGPPPGPAARAFQIGDVLSQRFEIKALLGEGGSGEVYRAYDRHRQMEIALKAIRPSLVSDISGVTTLRNELNTASQVSHPNVCRLYDITVAPPGQGASFITMELLTGESLASRIRRCRLRSDEAHPIVLQLVNGVAAAHECGIVHRDLKPANVLLVTTESGVRAVITDFGLAKEIKPGSDLTITLSQEVAGTPAYMAPEQLEGKRATASFDIYALGAIMFEMVTGRLPFEGETPLAIAAARLNNEAPSPCRYVPDLDSRWEQAILACLQRDRSKRPVSVFEILSLLELRPPQKWPRRTFLGALAAVSTAGVYALFKPPSRNPLAQAAFDRGLVFNQRRTTEGVENAIREFRLATTLEPRWALAWSNLADAYAAASNGEIMDPADALTNARDAARRAISLDGRLARAHGSLAWTLSLDFDEWPKAEAEFRRAIDLDGKDPEVRRWFAAHLRKTGQFREAERQVRAGLALTHSSDPRLLTELAFLLFTSRQTNRFQAEIREANRLFHNDSGVEFLYAKSLELDGKFAEAIETLDYAQHLGTTQALVLALKAGVAVSRNDRDEARRLALQIEQMWWTQPVDGLLLAGVYARLGDTGQAFQIIDEAYRRKDNTLLSLATSPWVDALRSDPRFREWLNRLHFTDQIMQRMEFKASSVSGSLRQPMRTGTSKSLPAANRAQM